MKLIEKQAVIERFTLRFRFHAREEYLNRKSFRYLIVNQIYLMRKMRSDETIRNTQLKSSIFHDSCDENNEIT